MIRAENKEEEDGKEEVKAEVSFGPWKKYVMADGRWRRSTLLVD